MALSYQECLQLIKEAHPDLYPIWYIEHDGQYLFNMLKRGVDKEEATSNFYAVDPVKGQPSGSLPVMSVYANEKLTAKLANPHKISPDDQKPVKHGALSGGVCWAITSENDALTHYGIKGQKWGVRRFQEEDGSLTAAGKERYRIKGSVNENAAKEEARSIKEDAERIYNEKSANRDMGFFEKRRTKNAAYSEALLNASEKATTDDLVDRSESKKGSNTEKVVTDIAFTVLNPLNVTVLAADGMMAAASAVKEKKYLKKREENSVFDEETGLYKKTEGEYDEKSDLAAVNPRFYDMNSNSKNNCMLCTTTYDLRQRGYDVTAQMDSEGYTFGDLKRWYPDAKMERNSRFGADGRVLKQKEYIQNTIDSLKKQGDGARGNLMVYFISGGAHSIVYEVKNGQLFFKDGQANKVYTEKATLMNSFTVQGLLNQTSVNSYARLDNIEPNLERIKAECCR